jgi:hypothetical protein
MLAAGSTALYWTDYALTSNNVFAVALGGGATVTLPSGSDRALDLAVSLTSLYWSTSGGSVMSLPIR